MSDVVSRFRYIVLKRFALRPRHPHHRRADTERTFRRIGYQNRIVSLLVYRYRLEIKYRAITYITRANSYSRKMVLVYLTRSIQPLGRPLPCIVLRVNAVLTNQKKITGAAPVGGIALILGWASMAFLKR